MKGAEVPPTKEKVVDRQALDLAYWSAYELRDSLYGWETFDERMELERYMDHICWMLYYW